MTSKIREELTMGGTPVGGGVMLSPEDSELSIEGVGTPIEGSMASPIESLISPAAPAEARRDTAPEELDTIPAKQERARVDTGAPANENQRAGRQSRRHLPRSESADPEKIRLIAEINAVWKRLEELETKRVRLREEVDELHLALSEEQRARSTAARGQRTAEEREASAVRALREQRARLEVVTAELLATQQRLASQRWEFLAKGAAAASGVLGAAVVLTRAVLARRGSGFRLPTLLTN